MNRAEAIELQLAALRHLDDGELEMAYGCMVGAACAWRNAAESETGFARRSFLGRASAAWEQVALLAARIARKLEAEAGPGPRVSDA